MRAGDGVPLISEPKEIVNSKTMEDWNIGIILRNKRLLNQKLDYVSKSPWVSGGWCKLGRGM